MEEKGIPNNDQSNIYNQITIKQDDSDKKYPFYTEVKPNSRSQELLYQQQYYPDSEQAYNTNGIHYPQDIEAESPTIMKLSLEQENQLLKNQNKKLTAKSREV